MEDKKSWGVLVGLGTLALTIPYMLLKIITSVCNLGKHDVLKEKVVVITGASSGIGEALAHVFYKQGCRVVLCARRHEELERVRADLLQQHSIVPTHLPIITTLDLSNLDSFGAVVDKIIGVTGHIDYLINNGGISNRGSVVDTNMDVFVKVMTVNYFGTIAFTKAVLLHMIKRKQGHIVLMSSMQGLISIPFRSAYGASKHALQAFADSLRAEIAHHNIRVTVISPGYVNTAISKNALTGSGEQHGVTDSTTANGYSAEYVAEKTCAAIVQHRKEIILAPLFHRFAVMMRPNIPNVYFYIMKKRAQVPS